MGAASIGASLRLLHRILEGAVSDGLVGTNNAHGVEPPALPHRPMRFLMPEEVEDLVDATPEDWKAFVMLAAWGGIRFGEMAALTTDRVDFEKNQVRIEETLAEVGGHLHLGPTKTKACRSVALPSFVMTAIRERFESWPKTPRLVFSSPEGGPVRRSNFQDPSLAAGGARGRAGTAAGPRAPAHRSGPSGRCRRPSKVDPGPARSLLGRHDPRPLWAPPGGTRCRRGDPAGGPPKGPGRPAAAEDGEPLRGCNRMAGTRTVGELAQALFGRHACPGTTRFVPLASSGIPR